MKVFVDMDRCVGHGRCYELAPEIFGEDEAGYCRLLLETVPPDLVAKAETAAANCPERVIRVED